MTAAPAVDQRARMPADERRRQLVAIGLRLLVDEPIHELSLDAVAREAGLSRSLLFHHFPTKRDFYVAVVADAAAHLLAASVVPAGVPVGERLPRLVDAYVDFVAAHRAQYRALVRHAAGGDEAVLDVFDSTRAELARRFLAAAGMRRSVGRERSARAWLAMTEELVLGDPAMRGGDPGRTRALTDSFRWLVEQFGTQPTSAPRSAASNSS